METLAGLVFASQDVPQGAWLSISPLKVIIECLLEVSPSLDRAFQKVVQPVFGAVREVDWKVLNHEKQISAEAAFMASW